MSLLSINLKFSGDQKQAVTRDQLRLGQFKGKLQQRRFKAKLSASRSSGSERREKRDEQGVPSPAPARTRKRHQRQLWGGKKELKVLVDDVDDKQRDLG